MKKQVYHIEPVYQSFVWGGKKLIERYGIKTDLENVGTIYNVIAIPGHLDNRVTEADMPLSQFYIKNPELFGISEEIFPVRMTITCNEGLQSYQVHPGDAYALKHEGTKGKISGSIVLDGGGKVRTKKFGHTAKTPEDFKRMVEEKDWDAFFTYVEVPDGDFLNTPAGVPHGGSGDGTVMVTYSTNSDITYRFYDFDRNDPKRPLHLQQTYDCANIPEVPVGPVHVEPKHENGVALYEYYDVPGEYRAGRIVVNGEGSYENERFVFYACYRGEGSVDGAALKAGETVFVPARYGRVSLKGDMDLIMLSYTPRG